MSVRALLLLLSMIIVSPLSAQVGADFYREVGSIPCEQVRDIAIRSDTTVLLSTDALSVVPLWQPGTQLKAVQSLRLQHQYDYIEVSHNSLLLFAANGRIATVELSGRELQLVQEMSLPDSLFALRIVGDQVFLAQGTSGLLVARTDTRQRIEPVARITRGAYYTDLITADSFLLALDYLHGFELYDLRSSHPQFISELTLYAVPSDASFQGDRLFVSYGTRIVDEWQLVNGQFVHIGAHHFPRRVTRLSLLSNHLIVAFSSGEIALYDPRSLDLLESLQQPSLVEKIVSYGHVGVAESVVILDASGSVSHYVVFGQELQRIGVYQSEKCVSAASVDRELCAVGAGGEISIIDLDVPWRRETVAEFASSVVSLSLIDSVIFAATAEPPGIYAIDLRRPARERIQARELSDRPRAIYVDRGFGSDYEVVAATVTGACGLTYERMERVWNDSWQIESPFEVTASAFEPNRLLLSTESGYTVHYKVDFSTGVTNQLPWILLPQRPRALLAVTDEYLASCNATGLEIYKLDQEREEYSLLIAPISITSAYDVAYDDRNQVLLVAGGTQPVRYFDFSEPERLGAAFAVAGSEGIYRLSASGGTIVALSHSGFSVWSGVLGQSGRQSTPPRLVASEFHPNPFNSATAIEIQVTEALYGNSLQLEIVNLLGQVVHRQSVLATVPLIRLEWGGVSDRGGELPSGVYLARLRVGEMQVTRKLIHVK